MMVIRLDSRLSHAATPEAFVECNPDGRSSPRTDARNRFETPIVGCDLQSFKRVDIENVVDLGCQFRTDTG